MVGMHSTVLITLLLGTLASAAVEIMDSPMTIGKRFMENFKAAIADRDEAKISDLVAKNFIFAECNQERNRDYLISHLTNLPKTAKYSMTMKNAVGQGGVNVRMEVSLKGLFGMSDVVFFISDMDAKWKIIFIQEMYCK